MTLLHMPAVHSFGIELHREITMPVKADHTSVTAFRFQFIHDHPAGSFSQTKSLVFYPRCDIVSHNIPDKKFPDAGCRYST
jgi:hypothetical protein